MSSGHYFDPDPGSPSQIHDVALSFPGDGGVPMALGADRGVFSAGRVDPGTVALLRCAPAPAGAGDLLDLGCGYGPIALTLARRSPAATVWALDVNRRALALTATNAARHGCHNVHPVAPGEVPAGIRFTEIWSNPPIRIGKAALHTLLSHWLPQMATGGTAWLVVHRHLGADSLAGWLRGEGWEVERRASKAGYRVLGVRGGAAWEAAR